MMPGLSLVVLGATTICAKTVARLTGRRALIDLRLMGLNQTATRRPARGCCAAPLRGIPSSPGRRDASALGPASATSGPVPGAAGRVASNDAVLGHRRYDQLHEL